MKNLVVSLIVVLVLVSGVVFGQTSEKKNVAHMAIELEAKVSNSEVVPGFKGYFTYAGKSKLGLFCWIQLGSYSQMYCGPSYDFKSWISTAVGCGVETGVEHPFKCGGSLWIGTKYGSNLLVIEKGIGSKSSNTWYRDEFTYPLNDKLNIGVATQKYSGTGPFVDYKVHKNISVGAEVHFSSKNSPVLRLLVRIRL